MITEARFADPATGSAYDAGDRERLIVLFGSRLGGIVAGQTPWGFVRSSEGVPASRLFLRDHRRAWYVHGVHEFPSSSSLAALIGLLAAGHGRTVLFGASMGGYGALLYGRVLGLPTVVVNPQTSINRHWLASIGDHRWDEDLPSTLAYAGALDLATIPSTAECRIIYATGQPLDVAHARHLAGPGVTLDPRDSDAHDLARHLASTGELAELLAGDR